MPISINWDNPQKTIIRNEFEGSWTWNEFVEAMDQVGKLMQTVSHPVDILGNMRPGNMPKTGNAIAVGRSAMLHWPANFQRLVLVTNPLLEVLGNTFKKMDSVLGPKMILVRSLEAAYEVLSRPSAV